LPGTLRQERNRALTRLASNYGLRIIYLFGSMADLGVQYLTGQDPVVDDPLADLDIGVVRLSKRLSAAEQVDLYGALSVDLQALFEPFSTDLMLLEETHSVLQAEALSGICIHADSQELREEYEERVLARAADFGPFLSMFYRERLEERHDQPHSR